MDVWLAEEHLVILYLVAILEILLQMFHELALEGSGCGALRGG